MNSVTNTATQGGEGNPSASGESRNAHHHAQLLAGLANIHEDALLDRRKFSAALTAAGFPVSEATLATKAVRGGGPPYQLFGRKPLYRWGTGLEWARSRLSEPAATTSEHGVRAA
jgi:hypothetical protein